jgi:hypothetical protein
MCIGSNALACASFKIPNTLDDPLIGYLIHKLWNPGLGF